MKKILLAAAILLVAFMLIGAGDYFPNDLYIKSVNCRVMEAWWVNPPQDVMDHPGFITLVIDDNDGDNYFSVETLSYYSPGTYPSLIWRGSISSYLNGTVVDAWLSSNGHSYPVWNLPLDIPNCGVIHQPLILNRLFQ